MRLLSRLERRFGRYAIPNLTWVIVVGMTATYLLSLAKPEFASAIAFDANRVRHGEIWRVITFVFYPPESSSLWVLFYLYFTLLIGNMVEAYIGRLAYNLFWLDGISGTIVAGLLLKAPVSNDWLLLSGFLAFATIQPNYQFMIFFIIPLAVKWLAMVDAAFLVYRAATGDWGTRAAILAAFSNYFLFFGRDLANNMRAKARDMTPRPVSREWRRPTTSAAPVMGARTCAICGASEKDGADIRVCSCEKCGGKPRNLCLSHARAH